MSKTPKNWPVAFFPSDLLRGSLKEIYTGYYRDNGKNMETAIYGLGFRVLCGPHVHKPPRKCKIQIPERNYKPTVILAHITLGRKKDSFYINIRNPIPQKV